MRAQPAPPSTFQGTVSSTGEVAGGLDVDAYIGGELCTDQKTKQTERIEENGVLVTVYRVHVVSSQETPGCGFTGAEVRFQIDGRFAEEVGTWGSGPQELNLTLEDGPSPPVEPTPTPTAHGHGHGGSCRHRHPHGGSHRQRPRPTAHAHAHAHGHGGSYRHRNHPYGRPPPPTPTAAPTATETATASHRHRNDSSHRHRNRHAHSGSYRHAHSG